MLFSPPEVQKMSRVERRELIMGWINFPARVPKERVVSLGTALKVRDREERIRSIIVRNHLNGGYEIHLIYDYDEKQESCRKFVSQMTASLNERFGSEVTWSFLSPESCLVIR
jgi:hypothetical protein